MRTEKSIAAADDDDDDDDKHRTTISKSKIDTRVAAVGEKTMNGALGGQMDYKPNGDMAGRVNLECALGSSKDI